MEIVNYPNYLVYEDGRVFNKKTRKFLKPILKNVGYYCVNLCKDGKRKTSYIHRLVAQAYIPNPDNKPMIDHIDRVRTNNEISNLRWATHSENQQNKGAGKDNTSGIKNISWNKQNKSYSYKKTLLGNKHLKYFKTIEEAHAYKIEYEKTLVS